MKASSLLPLISVLTFALGSASGQSQSKLEKAFAGLSLEPGETAKLIRVSPSFQTPLLFLEVTKRDSWTIQVERFARHTEVPTVELSFAMQMAKTERGNFDPRAYAKAWENFLKEVKEADPNPTPFDGIGVELRTRMGDAKEVTASVNLTRLPIGVPHEQISPGLDALLARLLESTGILPRFGIGSAVGVGQKDSSKN